MTEEGKSPVEQFNAQLENAILEYKEEGRGKIILTPAGFAGMVGQFLSDPVGTAALAGDRAKKQVSFLRIMSENDRVRPRIYRDGETATAEVTAEDVKVAVLVQPPLLVDVQQFTVIFTQSANKPHQVELKKLKMEPDMSIEEVLKSLGKKPPFPVPGKIVEVAFGAFSGDFIMSGLRDTVADLVISKGAEIKPARIEIDILPEDGTVEMVLIAKGLDPKYPSSLQYVFLKKLAEWLSTSREKD